MGLKSNTQLLQPLKKSKPSKVHIIGKFRLIETTLKTVFILNSKQVQEHIQS